MKISERLALLKAGYTKDDIAEMIGEEAKAPEQGAEPEAKSVRMTAIWTSSLRLLRKCDP